MSKCIKNICIILICIVFSGVLVHFFSYGDNEIVNLSFTTTTVVALFSVSLTIVALLINLLDKYKENTQNNTHWDKESINILKALSENTLALLILILLLFILAFFEQLLAKITLINIVNCGLIFSLIYSIQCLPC